MSDATVASGRTQRPSHGAIDVPWNLVVPEVDVHLVGYGDRPPNDFTLETLAVLKRCTRVFGLPPIVATAFGVPPMEDLREHCVPDRSARDAHEAMAEAVLVAAAMDPPVAIATYGSPMVGTYAAHRIIELAPQHGLTFHVTNAVPTFDRVWADLNIDPFVGLEIWEAAAFVADAVAPGARGHLLLVNTGQLDGADLREHLLRFYAAEHEVVRLTAGAGAGPLVRGGRVQPIALGRLEAGASAGSLLVPRPAGELFDFERAAP